MGKSTCPIVRPFTDAGAVDPRYQNARKKVKVIERKDWAGGRSAPWSTPVTIYLKDGRKFTKSVNADDLRGGPKNPLSREELVARYRAMTEGFLSSSSIMRSLDLISNLENQGSISELMKLVTFGK